MKLIKPVLALSAIAVLTGCGLRGDLETPPPIFSKPPSAEAKVPVDAGVEPDGSDVAEDATVFNSLGGEIPKPAPDVDVEEENMGEVSPG